MQQRTGEAEAALHHPEVGDIDLIWGREGTAEKDYEDGFGVAKLIKKHPEVLNDLQGFIAGLKKNEARSGKNRAVLESQDSRAAVRLDWDGKHKKWLMTAYRKDGNPAVTERRTGVSNHAESAPPAEQGAGLQGNSITSAKEAGPAATDRRTNVAGHAEPTPPVGQVAELEGNFNSAGQNVVLQNRNRASAASIAQMNAIDARPDYLRAGVARSMDQGAPVVFGVGT